MKGVLRFKGAFRFDGNFSGEIITDDTLIVGNSAKLEANLDVGILYNMGEIKGDIHASKKVSIMAGSRVAGNIDTPMLVAEEGAVFTGSCMMPETPPAVSETDKVDLKQQKALMESFPEMMPKTPKASGLPGGVELPAFTSGKKRKTAIAAAAALLLTGSSVFYFIHVSKNEILSNSLSRLIYEKFAQNDVEKLAKIGMTYIEEQKFKKSVRVHARLKNLLRGDKSVSLKLAQSLEMIGKTDEAIAYYEDAFKAFPDRLDIVGRLKSYYTANSDVPKLIGLQKRIVIRNPENRADAALLFDLYKNDNQLEEALNLYVSNLASMPMTASDYLITGKLEKRLDRMKDAIKSLSSAIAANSADIESYLELAYAYHKAGLEYKAMRKFYTVATMNPDHVEALNNKGFRYLKLGRTDKALEFFNMAQIQDEENLRSWLGIATTYSRRGDGEMAERYCRKILAVDPDYSPALNRLAWVYAQDNRNLDQAKDYSLASMKYYNGLPEYLDTLSEVYYKKKEYKKAVTYMKYAIKAQPGNKYFRTQMRKFKVAINKSKPVARTRRRNVIKPRRVVTEQTESKPAEASGQSVAGTANRVGASSAPPPATSTAAEAAAGMEAASEQRVDGTPKPAGASAPPPATSTAAEAAAGMEAASEQRVDGTPKPAEASINPVQKDN